VVFASIIVFIRFVVVRHRAASDGQTMRRAKAALPTLAWNGHHHGHE